MVYRFMVCVLMLAGFLAVTQSSLGQEDAPKGHLSTPIQETEDVSTYSLPADVVRVGPFVERSSQKNANSFFYYRRGDVNIAKELIGKEVYHGDALVLRDLYKNGKRHGVQREWDERGQLRSEKPYRTGIMDGIYKYWDKKGNLVGQYLMKNGQGAEVIYNSAGLLVSEIHYLKNWRNGVTMQVLEDWGIRSIIWFIDDRITDRSYDFYSDGTIKSVVCYNNKGQLHGVAVFFLTNGNIMRTEYFINGGEVKEKKYMEEAAKDRTLFKVPDNHIKYLELITDEVKKLELKYRTMARVKIPLEFDAEGTPILAPVDLVPKTSDTAK